MKNIIKKIIFSKKFYIFLSLTLLFFISIAFILGNIFVENETSKFVSYTDSYKSDQKVISSISEVSSSNTISLSEIYNYDSIQDAKDDGKISTEDVIITISSGIELYNFSYKLKNNTVFRSYTYNLICNIDYSDSNDFIPIESFSGIFNGNGYEIKNLKLTKASTENDIKYVSMFATNQGTITNFGLVNPNINISNEDIFVAPICGYNSGNISYVFVRDLRDPDNELDAGMVVNGYVIVAGLVYKNGVSGKINDCYTAFDIIVNLETIDIINQFSEIISENEENKENNEKGEINNVFFYHKSIESYEKNDTNNTIKIEYDNRINKEFTYKIHYGTYCNSLAQLKEKVTEGDNNWYDSNEYGSLSSSLNGIITPISRGIKYDDNTKTFSIKNVTDYCYMYELMNLNAKFASKDITYSISGNIDLSLVPKENYIYNYTISSNIIGEEIENSIANIDNSNTIKYPTIYNAEITKNTIEGIDCYGLFPYFSGTLSNLNIANNNINIIESSNIKAIGMAVGYLDGGKLENVNTYGNISFSSKIGKFFVGHVSGLASSNAEIKNVTSSGEINNESGTYVQSPISGYMNGSAIGGILGYSSSTMTSLNKCLSNTSITSSSFNSNSSDISIGGILGAGYTKTSQKLENIANINVTGSSKNIYVSGIIGRHLGMSEQSSYFNNEGNITVTLNDQDIAMISGVTNADIITNASENLDVSQLKLNGRFQYNAASFTNRANVNLTNSAKVVRLTNVLNIHSANGFESNISGIYNLQYNSNGILDVQNVSMDYVYEYAPVVNVNSSSTQTSSQKINATTIYNLRNINIMITSSLNDSNLDLKYSGCILGDYINYEDVRNEGDISFSNAKSVAITVKTLKVFGVFENVSAGYFANNIFNGGDINLDIKNTITANVYFSGICFSNRNGFSNTEINEFNPAHSLYDSSKIGSINNAINNGIISVKSDKYEDIKYGYQIIKSGNGQSDLGNSVDTIFSKTQYRIDGNLYVSGITSLNESVITNSFNLGNLYSANYVTSTSNYYEVNAGGISVLNLGMYAYILNSANSGDIKAINMSSHNITSYNSSTYEIYSGGIGTTYLSNVNSSGITCRNDLKEDGSAYGGNINNPNSKQLISFTINYGSIYSYNYRYNMTSSAEEPGARSAGILAMGLCNVINVVNYGNIYGSETASGIFGIVYLNKYKTEISSDINIANTINYGNVYMLEKGYNYIHDKAKLVNTNTGKSTPDAKCADYSTIISFDDDNVKSYAKTSIIRNTQYISVIGSIFSIVNFGGSDKAQNLKIRYLISFNDIVSIVGFATAIPTGVSTDVTSFYSAYSSMNAKTGATQLDSWMDKFVNYIPMTTTTDKIFVVKSINSDGTVSTETKEFYGAFSSNFAFRQAINGNTNYIDIVKHPTDAFISDYFQFVSYNFINENLLDRIGWRSIAYITAANDFAQSIENVTKVLNLNGIDYSSFTESALETDSWLVYASNDTILKIFDALAEECNLSNLKEMLIYIFSDAKSEILVTPELRNNIYNSILELNEEVYNTTEILNSILTYENGYSKFLSNVILDYNDAVSSFLNDYISSLSDEQVETIFESYIEYLNVNNNAYFTLEKNKKARLDLLYTLFENIDDDVFYSELIEIFNITISENSYSSSDGLTKLYSSFASLDTEGKKEFFLNIFRNNNEATMSNYIDSMLSEINYYKELSNNGYNITSVDQVYTNASIVSGENNSSTTLDQRIALWNQIRKTETFKSYLGSLYTTTHFKATEYNNTYQSITEPHNEGAYLGETTERLGYYYTTEVTPQTYFYGPLTSSGTTRNTFNGSSKTPIYNKDVNTIGNDNYVSVFHYSDDTLWTDENIMKSIMKSRGGDNSTTTYNSYLHQSYILMYYDYANEQLGEANASKSITVSFEKLDTGTKGTETIKFKGFEDKLLSNSKSFKDPMNDTTYKTSDWTGVEFTKNDWTMTVNYTDSIFETFSLSEGAISCIFYEGGGKRTLSNGTTITVPNIRTYIKDTNGTYHPLYGNYSLTNGKTTYSFAWPTDSDATRYTQYSYLCYLLGKKYYTSTATVDTGIYRRSQSWDSSQYFTWKQQNNNRVYTSQYINYTIDDILNLDGYLTEYKGSIVQSSDERDIISSIFNNCLCKTEDSSNKFKLVIKKALLESLGNNNTNGNKYIEEFIYTNIYSNTNCNTLTAENAQIIYPIDYLKYNSAQTIREYLLSSGSENWSNNNKFKLFYYAISNKDVYLSLINSVLNYYDPDYSSQDNYEDYKYLMQEVNNNSSLVDDSGNIVLSQLSGKESSELYQILSPFDDPTKVREIDLTEVNVTGEGIKAVASDAVIDEKNYLYGIIFSSITLNFNTNTIDSLEISLDAKSKNDTNSTLGIKYSNNSTNSNNVQKSISVKNSQSYTETIFTDKSSITLNPGNTSTITLTSTNSNIILYDISISVNSPYNYEASPNAPTYKIPSFDGIKNTIVKNDLSITNRSQITNCSINSMVAEVTNNDVNFDLSNVYLYYLNGETEVIVTNYIDIAKEETKTLTFNTNITGKTLYIGYTVIETGTGEETITFDTTKLIISKVSIDTIYGYSIKLLNNEDIFVKRLMTINMEPYSIIQEKYVKTLMKKISRKEFISEFVFDFVPMNTGTNESPINPVLDMFNDAKKEKFIVLIINAYKNYFIDFINNRYTSADTDVEKKSILSAIINNIINDTNNYQYLSDIIYYGNDKKYLNDNIKLLLTASYIVSDYSNILTQSKLNDKVNISSTEYKTLLSQLDSKYQYINTNGSIDNDNYDEFIKYLECEMATSGYGIFALSSNKGILNGEFIPDNLVLDDMDTYYEFDSKNSIFKLATSTSSNWRGGTSNNENYYSSDNKNTVNYAFLVKMKQLKKSIGTTIFRLDLMDSLGITHYSSESSIDLENGIITYYVPNNYFIDDEDPLTDTPSKTLKIINSSISISNAASIYIIDNYTEDLRNSNNTTTITLDDSLVTNKIIRVYAEESSVYKDYEIEFIGMNIDFILSYNEVLGTGSSMTDSKNATVGYKDCSVILSLTSDSLPEKLDLTPYIDIYNNNGENNGEKLDRSTSFKLSREDNDHIIDDKGDSIITMSILSTLPKGEYTIKVNIFGKVDFVNLTKNPSTECSILEFEYDGVDISNSLNSSPNEYTNYIDFGRAFNQDELINNSSSNFYLNRFSISENATVTITATKTEENSLLKYDILYQVTAENGESSKTYHHYLMEKHPFVYYNENGPDSNTNFVYATTYKDGDRLESLIYDSSDDNSISVEFNRGFEPQYRIKYTLSNFYLLVNNFDSLFNIDYSDDMTGIQFEKSYGGLTAILTDNCDAGEYTFTYIYKNTGIWDDSNYDRIWEFPSFTIIKKYSEDATLNNITYIDGLSMLSSTSTVLSAEKVFRPSKNLEDSTNEIDYDTFSKLDNSLKGIEAEGTKINYNNAGVDYSIKDYTDYYLVGSLSNAKLSFYAPIFKIEEHAEIYQYTTKNKLTKYGLGAQDQGETDISDKEILTDHSERYLYVPYASKTGNVETITIFLVAINDKNEWGKVYTVESNATVKVADLNGDRNRGFTISDGTTETKYYKHSSAGKATDNTSLYMDYIGTPLDDHFWYVSYVVFSEDSLKTENTKYVKYYHLALIDLTNNLYFDIQVNAPLDLKLDSIYFTFAAEHVATQTDGVYISKQLSVYVKNTNDDDNNIYLIDREISFLPTGYYYFYLDLPNGYKVTYEITNGKTNKNDGSIYKDAYYPPSSIVTQKISIVFTVVKDTGSSEIWGVSTSALYSILAKEKEEETV